MRTAMVALVCIITSQVGAQSTEAIAKIETILVDYEVIRDALANDRGAPVAAAARRIHTHSLEAAPLVSGSSRAQLRALASKARALAVVEVSNMRELRRGFGRLSEPLITLVRATPQLRRGRHLFDCPMAEGYGGWIQNDDQIANPYMGQRMLTCGASRDW